MFLFNSPGLCLPTDKYLLVILVLRLQRMHHRKWDSLEAKAEPKAHWGWSRDILQPIQNTLSKHCAVVKHILGAGQLHSLTLWVVFLPPSHTPWLGQALHLSVHEDVTQGPLWMALECSSSLLGHSPMWEQGHTQGRLLLHNLSQSPDIFPSGTSSPTRMGFTSINSVHSFWQWCFHTCFRVPQMLLVWCGASVGNENSFPAAPPGLIHSLGSHWDIAQEGNSSKNGRK